MLSPEKHKDRVLKSGKSDLDSSSAVDPFPQALPVIVSYSNVTPSIQTIADFLLWDCILFPREWAMKVFTTTDWERRSCHCIDISVAFKIKFFVSKADWPAFHQIKPLSKDLTSLVFFSFNLKLIFCLTSPFFPCLRFVHSL